MKLILGSSSAPRKKLLQEWGFAFEVNAPDVDEKSIRHEDPHELVKLIAEAKAEEVAQRSESDAIIIASDSVTVVGGEIREKPESAEQAYAWIEEMASGVPVRQVTSVAVLRNSDKEIRVDTAEGTVTFNQLQKEAIDQFVESGDVFNFAGAYAIEHKPFEGHVASIEGEYETIVGLPKQLTLSFLKELGYDF